MQNTQNQLVFYQNEQVVTTSRLVADKFNKQHAHVLRAIKSLECSANFTESNFGLSEYIDPTGRSLPQYIITKDGFTFLVMGFTGKDAAKFKEDFICQFNKMERLLKSDFNDHLLHWAKSIDNLRASVIEQHRRLSDIENKMKLIPDTSGDVNYFTVQGYALKHGYKLTASDAVCIGKNCVKLSNMKDMKIGRIDSTKYGRVNTYHKDVLHRIFESLLKPGCCIPMY